MKKLDAELVLINPDATEAERLDCAKFYRQQVRSYLTQGESCARVLGIPVALPPGAAHAMQRRAEAVLTQRDHLGGQPGNEWVRAARRPGEQDAHKQVHEREQREEPELAAGQQGTGSRSWCPSARSPPAVSWQAPARRQAAAAVACPGPGR
jgi:hypothetical protein